MRTMYQIVHAGPGRRPQEVYEAPFQILAGEIVKELGAWQIYEAALRAHGLDPEEVRVHAPFFALVTTNGPDAGPPVPVLFPSPHVTLPLDRVQSDELSDRVHTLMRRVCSKYMLGIDLYVAVRVVDRVLVRQSLLRATRSVAEMSESGTLNDIG